MIERNLKTLRKIIDLANSPSYSGEKFKEMANLISEEFGVENCRVYVTDKNCMNLSLKAINDSGYSGEEISSYRIGSGLVGATASKKELMSISDISYATVEELALLDEADRYSFFASSPIVDDKTVYGVLYISSERPRSLRDADRELLYAVSQVIATSLREERHQAQAQKVAREFSILYDISTATMTTIKLDRLLHIILTAVTVGDGLEFNRAILMLVNERSNIIQGMMGVGPDTIEEAWKAWGEFSRNRRGLLEIVSAQMKEGKAPSSRLNEIAKTIRLPLDSPCIVARTVREQRSFNVGAEDEDQTIGTVLSEKLGLSTFASVPLMASGKVVGVIIVDNCFNKRPITDEDIRFLTMFANQAGLSIENSLLYSDINEAHLELKETHERLLQSEKLAALGEMAANVAHEIRNPLTSLGGFARRLLKKVEGHTEKRYAEIIVKEVDRLEGLLTDILVLSKKSAGPFKSHNVNKIIDSVTHQLSDELKKKKVELKKELADSLPGIDCDFQQLKQVFINLLTNSIQAMQDGGTLTIGTYLITEAEKSYVGISIADTGGGIPENFVNNIFNPFFTTKDTGTGLGLSISNRIVAQHRGEIELINRPGEGATFIVKLPIIHEES
ncbi:MAG: GAF domain-containing protein [Deltaproteobacteria bacterium]|nr:GAF domain-containing protein [Deltaproteobacteria bacterium]